MILKPHLENIPVFCVEMGKSRIEEMNTNINSIKVSVLIFEMYQLPVRTD